MLFNSYIFIFLFFPLTLAGYYLLGRMKSTRPGNIFLIGMSLWFYGYFNPSYLAIICSSIILNYIISKIILALKNRRAAKLLTAAGVIMNVGIIFYFKYYDFFIENVNVLFKASFELKNIVLPLGISFFTFQQISYIVDSYHGETESYAFDEYALFVSYFPQLIAGPIVLHSELMPQIRDRSLRRFNSENFSRGIFTFAVGLFKKVLIADTFSKAVVWGYANVGTIGALEAWIVSLSYMFQLYFDFSGYCDMAIGIGQMMNIKLPQNFNSPYKALSIPEYWARWHMSLQRFLRSYIYFPLGGSRRGEMRTYFNIMVVFLVSGMWHGADWTFIIWGIIQGVLVCLTRRFKTSYEKLSVPLRWMLTFGITFVLLVLFRAPDMATAKEFYRHMFLSQNFAISGELAGFFWLDEFQFFYLQIPEEAMWYLSNYGIWIFLLGSLFAVLEFKNSGEWKFKPTVWRSVLTIVMLFWSIISLSGVSEFLYFDF